MKMSDDNSPSFRIPEESHQQQHANNGESDIQTKNRSVVYVPGISRALKRNEELVYDRSAYKIMRLFQCGTDYILVAGTQADKIRNNGIVLMRLSNLEQRKQKEDENENSSSSDSENEEEENRSSKKDKPLMLSCKIPHHGGVNRIRVTQISSATVCAVWNDQGKVQLWNLANCLKSVEEMGNGKAEQSAVLTSEKPVFSFAGHQCEGFAIDWSLISAGKLASGDNRKRIHVWHMGEGGTWSVDHRPFTGHNGSVEDIQWSPSEDNVFASCSSDGTIRLWDARVSPSQACVCTVENAHDSDVNVISWNKKEPFLLSGGDDAAIKVWDLKTIQYKNPVALFSHHRKPICSVQWYPFESTVFAAAAEDDQVTIWDLALEEDEISQQSVEDDSVVHQVPPQLLFVHCGQSEIKELRWHPQIAGLLTTTAHDGFNIFRSINM